MNNFWNARIAKQKQLHEKNMLEIKNNHEIKMKKIIKFQEAKIQSINEFMLAVGKYYSFEQDDDSRIALYSSYAKILPYLSAKAAEIFSNVLSQKSEQNRETAIYELARCLHDNEINPDFVIQPLVK